MTHRSAIVGTRERAGGLTDRPVGGRSRRSRAAGGGPEG